MTFSELVRYSLVIEATADPNFFGFFSPELEGFSGWRSTSGFSASSGFPCLRRIRTRAS